MEGQGKGASGQSLSSRKKLSDFKGLGLSPRWRPQPWLPLRRLTPNPSILTPKPNVTVRIVSIYLTDARLCALCVSRFEVVERLFQVRAFRFGNRRIPICRFVL